jgi:aromatic ring-opening dioxygenase catalytic subunit (LigB family)
MGRMSQGMEPLREYIQHLPIGFPQRPKALLVISAHWEEAVPTVQTGQKPPMLYDYYGFPKEAYELTWPAPGSPETAGRVRELLSQNKIQSGEDASRGFDHGNFVVTKLMYPDADIPTLQLSLTSDLDPKRLLDIGRALAPLRNEGVLILGSGFSYHNMRGFMRAQRGDPGPIEDSKLFDDWLYETLDRPPSERETRLIEWAKAPRARECHPREEHLLPLMVCVGAAENSKAEFPYRTPILGTHTLAAHFA